MGISEALGRRHVRFTRTVKREIDGRGIVADIWVEAYFPLETGVSRYEIDLVKSKGGGVVTVAMSPEPPAEVEILDAGATVIAFGAEETQTSCLDLVAETEATMTDDRAAEIIVEMALLKARGAPVKPVGRRSLLVETCRMPLAMR